MPHLYLKAVWLPTSFTVACTALTISASPLFVIPAILGAGDTVARLRDYNRLKNVAYRKTLIDKMAISNCQRNVAIAIWGDKVNDHYYEEGYRWYHVLPDGSFSIKNNVYLKPIFYKRLLGI